MSTYIAAGLVFGSIYAISALGIVLTYVSSGVFNFAHGGIALLTAWSFYSFNTRRGWSIPVSAVLSIAVVAPLIGLLLWWLLFRKLTGAPLYIQLVATIGLFVAIPGTVQLVFGNREVFSPTGLGGVSAGRHRILGVNVNDDQIMVCVAAALIAVLLALVLRFTTIGLKQRAVVDTEEMASLSGINPSAVSALSWAAGSMLAGLSGVLIIPFIGLKPEAFTQLIVGSFAAVVIGRFRSLPLTFAGAIVVGLIQKMSINFLSPTSQFAVGLQAAIPFFIMVAWLLLRRPRDQAREAPPDLRLWTKPVVPLWLRRVGLGLVAAAALLVPLIIENIWIALMTGGVATAFGFLSYVLVTGEGGMISLCQISFAGLGAIFSAKLISDFSVPMVPAILLSSAIVTVAAAIIALPTIRLSGLYLALATLGFALLSDNLVFRLDTFFHKGYGIPVGRPEIFGFAFDTDLRYYYLVLAIFLVVGVGVIRLQRSTLGSALTATRGSSVAAESIGLRPSHLRLLAFALSALIASVGGALYGIAQGRALPTTFGATAGLIWLAVFVIWGSRSAVGAFVGGMVFILFPQIYTTYISSSTTAVPTVLFGLAAIGLAQEPRGVVTQVGGGVHGLISRWKRDPDAATPAAAVATEGRSS